MRKPILKYNIDKKLLETSEGRKDYYNRIAELQELLAITRTTWYEWRNIQAKDKQDVPAGKLKLIADYLKCDINDLYNTAAVTEEIKK